MDVVKVKFMQQLSKSESTKRIDAGQNKYFGTLIAIKTCTVQNRAIKRVLCLKKEDKRLNLETKKTQTDKST